MRILQFISILFFALIMSCQQSSQPLEESGYLQANGADFYFQSFGNGEPLIVLHGGPGLDHTYFLPQMQQLSRNYHLIFYDQRACGRSSLSVQPETMSMDGFVEDLEALRVEMGLDQINLMGHSWGGLLAMHYAIKYPQHLKSMILMSSVGASTAGREQEAAVLQSRRTRTDSVEQGYILESDAYKSGQVGAYQDIFRILFRSQFYDRKKTRELTLTFQETFRETSRMMHLLGPDLREYDLGPKLEQVQVPTLLLYGDYDPWSTLAAPDLADHLPNARLEVISNCGHFPYIEKPQEFFKVVRNFIEDQ